VVLQAVAKSQLRAPINKQGGFALTTSEMPESLSLRESWKYLSYERLPQIDAETTFMEVYLHLNRSGCSGFILTDRGEPRGYVKADELAARVVARASGDAHELREYSSKSIGEIISIFSLPLVPIRPAVRGASESDLYQAEETVFRIAGADGSTGWYLNHETVRDAATKRTVFICSNGHQNTDSDHGTCYRCPFPIVSTVTV
jgi:hypothetical protein